MPREYKSADTDATETMHELIDEHHDHLKAARVELVFLTEAAKSKGREIWGRAKMISGLAAWLATERSAREKRAQSFFAIEISESIWQIIDEKQRRALIDHCLSYCQIGESEEQLTLKLAAPDIEEFSSVVGRHGLYFEELQKFVETANQATQQSLFESAELGKKPRAKRNGKAAHT
jgi:hypothetical protein